MIFSPICAKLLVTHIRHNDTLTIYNNVNNEAAKRIIAIQFNCIVLLCRALFPVSRFIFIFHSLFLTWPLVTEMKNPRSIFSLSKPKTCTFSEQAFQYGFSLALLSSFLVLYVLNLPSLSAAYREHCMYRSNELGIVHGLPTTFHTPRLRRLLSYLWESTFLLLHRYETGSSSCRWLSFRGRLNFFICLCNLRIDFCLSRA